MNAPSGLSGWREPILAQFTPEIAAVARLTVVADPDRLLAEQGIVDGIRQRGFEIVLFEDHVAFRYAYERRFRQHWDAGETTNLLVLLCASTADVSSLPFDLLDQARRDRRLLTFSLAELFPTLAPHVVGELERGDLNALFAAQYLHQPGCLGENATRDFVLRHVFEVDPALIKSTADLLRMLLRRHYRGRVFPSSLDDRLTHLLQATGQWRDWPLDQLVRSRVSFFEFLQERWPIFLQRAIASERGLKETAEPYDLRYEGPTGLPFDHDDVRVYLDNLFTEGMLAPTRTVAKSAVCGTWMAAGVDGTGAGDHLNRLEKLIRLLEEELPDRQAVHTQWLQTAYRWAEIIALRWAAPSALGETQSQRVHRLHERMEQTFADWLDAHYASLHSLAYLPRPVMVHQIPYFLAHGLGADGGAGRRALVVVDGLAIDQWVVAHQALAASRWSAEDGAVFAWVPTLTAVSRQSIFAGNAPFFFATSIGTTQKEPQLWSRFWEDRGLRRSEIAYVCQKSQEHDDAFLARVRTEVEIDDCRIAGIVVGTVDQMLHGTVTGTDGLHASVRHWAQRASLWSLVDMLVDTGFEVYLTADHGNIEGEGIGKPNVGLCAEERGERAYVFRDDGTRMGVASLYPGCVFWPTTGLPDDYLALIAPQRRAFIADGKRTVAHGGISLEEVVVPFIQIVRR
ncbi:MAG: BREX-3 system phosphatase PglZ [Rhodospirillales bacterium]